MKIEVIKAVAGNDFLYRNGTYNVPDQIPLDRAKELIKAGHAVEVQDARSKAVVDERTHKIEKRVK